MRDDTNNSGRGLDGSGLWMMLAFLAVCGVFLLVAGQGDAGRQAARPEVWSGWKTVGIVALILVGLLAASLVAYALIRMVLSLRAAWHAQRHQQKLDSIALQRTAGQAVTDQARAALDAARLVPWAEHGRLGALVVQAPQGLQIVNLDAEGGALLLGHNGRVERLLADPLALAQLQLRHELETERARASAYPGLTTYNQRLQLAGGNVTEAERAPDVSWPDKVLLSDVAPNPATLGGLVLGIAPGPGRGVPRPVAAALAEMVHVAVGGSSGWGKSNFMRELTYQLMTAVEPCCLALIDLEGVTFSPFAGSDRLLWPVADSEAGALAIMGELVEEMNRRKALYAALPGVDSLKAYNLKAPGEPLLPVVCLIDEATALLADRAVHNATRTLALRARKYGLWLVLGGQDWKAASIDTAIRNQLGTRVHFKASSPSQSRILLGDGCAAAIEAPGRAYIQLPGRPLTEMQAPLVTVADIEAALAGQRGPVVEPTAAPGQSRVLLSEMEARLVLWADERNGGRFSVRAVADAHRDEASRGEVQALADRLLLAGWLSPAGKGNTAPEVTADLVAEARTVLDGAGLAEERNG